MQQQRVLAACSETQTTRIYAQITSGRTRIARSSGSTSGERRGLLGKKAHDRALKWHVRHEEEQKMSAVERKYQLVYDALEAKNTKQALQLCTKRIKKGERGDYIHALRALVLTTASSPSQKEEGFREAKRLVDKNPAVTDVIALSTIRKALVNLDGLQTSGFDPCQVQELVTLVWDRALRARPKDEELARECFFSSLEQNDWKLAQKAAMSLQKMSNDREYYFWAIVCCHMLWASSRTPEGERKLFGTLAYRMISKAANEIPADPQVPPHALRSIHTPSELQLLLSIYRAQGFKTEALEVLDSANLGIASPTAKGEWDFVRTKLDLLEEQQNWECVWTVCKDLLDRQRRSNDQDQTQESSNHVQGDGDWRVWSALIRADTEVNSTEFTETTTTMIKSYLTRPRLGRNSLLANILFLKTQSTRGLISQDSTDLLSAFQRYLEVYGAKDCCYTDLCEQLEGTSSDTQALLLAALESPGLSPEAAVDEDVKMNEARRINRLRLTFHIAVTKSLEGSALQSHCLEGIKIFKDSLPHRPSDWIGPSPGDSTCMLSAMALIRLDHLERGAGDEKPTARRLLQALALLSYLAQKSRTNHEALLVIVRLHLLLGTGSLALQTYCRLAIKHVQNDTLAYNMFTRISSSLPWAVRNAPLDDQDDTDDLDPTSCLQRALKLYGKAKTQVPRAIRTAVEEGAYHQIFGFSEFATKLDSSICKFMFEVELQRIRRHRRSDRPTSRSSPFTSINQELGAISDQRDDSAVPNCFPASQKTFEQYIRLGPKPNHRWLIAFRTAERLITKLTSDTDSRGPSKDQASDMQLTLGGVLNSEVLHLEFTAAELEYLKLLSHVLDTLGSGSNDTSDISKWLQKRTTIGGVEAIENGLRHTRVGPGTQHPTWEVLHEAYLTLDGLHLIKAYLRQRETENGKVGHKKAKAELQCLHDDIEQAYQKLRLAIAARKNGLTETGVIGNLVDLVLENDQGGDRLLGATIEDLVGEAWMETFASTLVDAWQESLAGVLRVNLD